MKSAIISILCASLVFNAESRVCVETITDGTNTAFRVEFDDPEPEMRSIAAFRVGYHLLVEASLPDGSKEQFATSLLLPEENADENGRLTVFHIAERIWPSGTQFSISLYDRDGSDLGATATFSPAVPGSALKMNWQGTVSPYESLRGVTRIGRTPSRHAAEQFLLRQMRGELSSRSG